jgi:hypothetical protein
MKHQPRAFRREGAEGPKNPIEGEKDELDRYIFRSKDMHSSRMK